MWAQLIIAAAIAAAAASSSWWLTKDHYEGVMAAAQIAAQAKVDAANTKADNAAIDWQAWADAQPAKIVYRNRKVADALKAAPEWSADPVPDSVRSAVLAAVADSGAVVPDSAMPAASAASAAGQLGPGAGVPGPAGFFRRLFQAPRGAGAGSEQPQP